MEAVRRSHGAERRGDCRDRRGPVPGCARGIVQCVGSVVQGDGGLLDGQGFVQYGAVDSGKTGNHPVAVVGMKTATINNLCQSVVVPVPVFGDVSMKLSAGADKSAPVEAKTLYIDADDLKADATFKNIDIGVAAGDAKKGPGIHQGDKADPNAFAQQADSVHFEHVQQRAWATTVSTFKLSGLKMKVQKGKHECY